MIRLQMTGKDREELDELIGKHPNTVIVESATRDVVRCKILVDDGAIYWEFADRDGRFCMIKTRLDDNALIFQKREVYRLAYLQAKAYIVAIRTAHRDRNERKAASPSPAMSKNAAKARNRAAQRLLPMELHSQTRPKRGRWQ